MDTYLVKNNNHNCKDNSKLAYCKTHLVFRIPGPCPMQDIKRALFFSPGSISWMLSGAGNPVVDDWTHPCSDRSPKFQLLEISTGWVGSKDKRRHPFQDICWKIILFPGEALYLCWFTGHGLSRRCIRCRSNDRRVHGHWCRRGFCHLFVG